jgi:hypothetical protein
MAILRQADGVAALLASQCQLIFVGSSRSVKPLALQRRSAGRRDRGCRCWRLRVQVGEDLLNHYWVFDTGDDAHGHATRVAALEVVIHGDMAIICRIEAANRQRW